MKISGLIIVRNAVLNDYPVVEAISSVLPMVDEMIVSIDKGEDNSEELIRSIGDPKIKIFYSTWDMSLREGGKLYGVETNKAKEHVSAESDWIFYIQADEIIHEKYRNVIMEAARKYKEDKRVDGLLFKYVHFYGTYNYIADSRGWYDYEVRIIRNDKTITSYKDAQGFRRSGKKIRAVAIGAEVFHYGWVKSPAQMKKKMNNIVSFYQPDDQMVEEFVRKSDVFHFDDVDYIRLFQGTHPSVMTTRVQSINWSISPNTVRRKISLKNKLLHFLEKITGRKWFVFRNYRLIKR